MQNPLKKISVDKTRRMTLNQKLDGDNPGDAEYAKNDHDDFKILFDPRFDRRAEIVHDRCDKKKPCPAPQDGSDKERQ